MTLSLLSRDPSILDGAAVFAGTRVPVTTLTDYFAAGETVDSFLADFPTVTRAQVLLFLEHAQARMAAEAV